MKHGNGYFWSKNHEQIKKCEQHPRFPIARRGLIDLPTFSATSLIVTSIFSSLVDLVGKLVFIDIFSAFCKALVPLFWDKMDSPLKLHSQHFKCIVALYTVLNTKFDTDSLDTNLTTLENLTNFFNCQYKMADLHVCGQFINTIFILKKILILIN